MSWVKSLVLGVGQKEAGLTVETWPVFFPSIGHQPERGSRREELSPFTSALVCGGCFPPSAPQENMKIPELSKQARLPRAVPSPGFKDHNPGRSLAPANQAHTHDRAEVAEADSRGLAYPMPLWEMNDSVISTGQPSSRLAASLRLPKAAFPGAKAASGDSVLLSRTSVDVPLSHPELLRTDPKR